MFDLNLGDQWIANLVGYHNGRVQRGEECFNKSVKEILDIQRSRGKILQPESVASAASEAPQAPFILFTPDQTQQVIYWQGNSKWCPKDGNHWRVAQDPLLSYSKTLCLNIFLPLENCHNTIYFSFLQH